MGAVCLVEDATHELRVAVKAYKPPAAAFRSDGFGMATWTNRARWAQLAARPSSPSSTGTQPAADADVTAIGAVDVVVSQQAVRCVLADSFSGY
jgi:hypothetical protein